MFFDDFSTIVCCISVLPVFYRIFTHGYSCFVLEPELSVTLTTYVSRVLPDVTLIYSVPEERTSKDRELSTGMLKGVYETKIRNVSLGSPVTGEEP